MTDAAERAREIAVRVYNDCARKSLDEMFDIMAAALREAENAAYEKAAQVALMIYPDHMTSMEERTTIADITKAIRALKTESNPQQ